MSRFIVGCPPGVGDFLWCLYKLRAFKRDRGIEHLMVVLQQTKKDRAAELARMAGFVDSVRYAPFRATAAEKTGYLEGFGVMNAVMWPNAVLDRGERIETWLPQYPVEWDLPLLTEEALAPAGRPILYASSSEVNRAWFPGARKDFWIAVAKALAQECGAKPVLIGASWDMTNADSLREHTTPLVGLTTLPQVAHLISRAPVVVGVASGMTILANHFRTPCVAFFPDKHHERFPWTWVHEAALKRYSVIRAKEIERAVTPEHVAAIAHNLWRRAAEGSI